MNFWQQNKGNQNAGSKVFQKRKYWGTNDHGFESANLSQQDLKYRNLEEDSDQDWEIKKIVGMRDTKEGREYKVVWASTWVNEKDLKNATSLISDFRCEKRVKFST